MKIGDFVAERLSSISSAEARCWLGDLKFKDDREI